MSSDNIDAERPAVIDWIDLLDQVCATRPHATPAEIRALVPALRDWSDRRLAKQVVLTRQRLAARAESRAGSHAGG
jgi:hypothetical protein